MGAFRHDQHWMRRYGLMVVALVFMLQNIAGPWMAASAMVVSFDDDGGVLICTGNGPVRVMPDGSQVPVKKSGANASDYCPLRPLIGGPALLPSGADVWTRVVASHTPQPLLEYRVATRWFLATLQPRAPPLV